MTPDEFHAILAELGIESIAELCRVGGFYRRTVQRWINDAGVPIPVQHMLRAWLRLARAGLDWRPGAEELPLSRRDAEALILGRPRREKRSDRPRAAKPAQKRVPYKRVLVPPERAAA